MEVSITINSRAAIAALTQTPARIDRAMQAGMTDATRYLLNQMRTYPPQRVGSAYIRTNMLKGSWHVPPFQGRGLTLVGRVSSNGNVAPYNRLVQDRDHQAAVHRGRWTNTAQAVSERSERTINQMFQSRLDAALR